MPEPAYKDKSSNCRPFKHINISSDGLQFLCISLCWSLLKTTSCPIADHAEILLLSEMAFNFYAWPCDFMTELRRRSLGSAGGMTWMIILCQAVLLTRYIKIAHPARTHCALTAHSPRTYGALKKWCHAAKGPMELHFIHAALGTSGSYILCFVLHALTRCQATKCINWECQYSMFLLCSTRFERVSGNKIDSLEVPTPSFALCFTCFERMLGDTIESLRVHPFKVSTVFALWEDSR